MVENYMDYTPQECKNAFTAGQRTRMRGCLESARSSLLESMGGIPVVDRDLSVTGLANVDESTCQASITPIVEVTNFGVESVHGFEMTTTLNDHAPFTTIHQTTVGGWQNHRSHPARIGLAQRLQRHRDCHLFVGRRDG